MESDVRFYARRAAQERQAAARALSEAAKEWHQTLAERYSKLSTPAATHTG